MDRRTTPTNVARNVTDVIRAAGATPESVAAATDIPLHVLRERLSGESPFTLDELEAVGGFFRTPIDRFFEREVLV